MIDYKVNEEQIKYSWSLVNSYNFGQRGRGDGNKNQQFVGILGQTIISDLLKLNRPNGKTGFDGGYDLIINNKKVDVKTMGRTVPVKQHYVHNFIGYQLKYEVDYLLFLSYNKKNSIMTICGYITKDEFLKKARFYPQGAERTRDDGTSFYSKAPLYEISQKDLYPLNSIGDIVSKIV